MVNTFYFSYFSGLKRNLTKSEIVGIGVLKGVQVAVFGMCCIDLNNDILKISGTHFSYNEKYKPVTDMQKVFKKWKMRNLTIEIDTKLIQNKTDIKNYFPIIYNNCSKAYYQ